MHFSQEFLVLPSQCGQLLVSAVDFGLGWDASFHFLNLQPQIVIVELEPVGDRLEAVSLFVDAILSFLNKRKGTFSAASFCLTMMRSFWFF